MAVLKQKLELTWVGKEERARLEPRILLEEPERSYVAPERVAENDLFDNRLIFGDNLLALKALEQEFSGKVKCIYVDPPFNTGEMFQHYDDGLEHSIWLNQMRDRLEILHRLLSPAGTLFLHIDDNELGYVIPLCDEVFGRVNRQYVVTFKQGSATGHKSINPGAVNTTNFVLIYAKSKANWKPNKVYTGRERDPRYGQFIANVEAPYEQWKFTTLMRAFSASLKVDERQARRIARDQPESLDQFVLANARSVMQLARPNYEAVSSDARAMIDRSEADPKRIFCLARSGHSDIYLVGGKRILFYADKLKLVDGVYVAGEPLTTLWDDVLSNNLHNEGNVEFPKGKKPEGLLKRVFELSTDPGDLVLDSFAGSGTTGAVAHKMGRRWIMIELGEHCHTHIIPRMQKVIDGTDQGGISKAVGWKGGGGFRYYRLAPTLLMRDKHGRLVINEAYNPEMLAEAMCKHMGFVYQPSQDHYWIHGVRPDSDDRSFLYVTTQHLTGEALASLSEAVGDHRHLAIACCAYDGDAAKRFTNLEVQKIPQAILSKCEFGEDYEERIKKLGWRAPEPEPESPKAAKSREAGQMEMFDDEEATDE